MSETRKGPTESLIEALDAEIRSRPRGAIRDLERALGKAHGWWQDRAKRRNVSLRHFVAALDHLGLNPVLFIRRHLGSLDGLELDQPRGPAPKVVEIGWKRLCAEEERPGVGEVFLDRVDQQRYHQPAKAFEVLETVVDLASLDELPRLLAIAGAALRAQMDFARAEHAYYAAIQGAQLRGDPRGMGNILRWYSYILLERGQWEDALRVTERATAILARENDALGLAKACAEQGQCLYYLDRPAEAIRALNTALVGLPEEEARYRCAALQTQGLVFQREGLLREAIDCIEDARRYAPALSRKHHAKLIWLRAKLAKELEDWATEEELLWSVVETLSETHYGEASLATCDLVRNLLVQGQPGRAFDAAVSMRALIHPLRSNKLVAAAIAELLRAEKEGLSLALVNCVRSKIESEQQRKHSWYQLRATASDFQM